MVAVATISLGACDMEPPDVGRLQRLYVPPAETVRIYSLGRGQTFGGLLTGAISANEQASLLMAFREHASPRRMRQGTKITLSVMNIRSQLRLRSHSPDSLCTGAALDMLAFATAISLSSNCRITLQC